MVYKRDYVRIIANSEFIKFPLCFPFFECPARAIAIHRTNLLRNPLSIVNVNFFRDGTTVVTATPANGTIVRAKASEIS